MTSLAEMPLRRYMESDGVDTSFYCGHYFRERQEVTRDQLVGVFAPPEDIPDMMTADHMALVDGDHFKLKDQMYRAGWHSVGSSAILKPTDLPRPSYDGDTMTIAELDVPQFVDGTNWFCIQGKGDVEPPAGIWSIRRSFIARDGEWQVQNTFESPHINLAA